MDQPRPRHSPRLPLIIERPDLAHPLARLLGLLLTSLAWLVWLGAWAVVMMTLGRKLGFDLPEIALSSPVSFGSIVMLLELVPWLIAAALFAVLLAYLGERFRTAGKRVDERWRPLGIERLARDAALDPQRIDEWQAAQILYVEHGPQGRVSNAFTERPEPIVVVPAAR